MLMLDTNCASSSNMLLRKQSQESRELTATPTAPHPATRCSENKAKNAESSPPESKLVEQ